MPNDTSRDMSTQGGPDFVENQSFRNEALTGSGTITTDGTLAPPLADPTAQRGLDGDRTSGGRRTLGAIMREENERDGVVTQPATTSDSQPAKRTGRTAEK